MGVRDVFPNPGISSSRLRFVGIITAFVGLVAAFFAIGEAWSYRHLTASLAGMGILVLLWVFKTTLRQGDREYWESLNSREVLGTPPFLAVDGIILLIGVILGVYGGWGIFLFFAAMSCIGFFGGLMTGHAHWPYGKD